MAATLHLGHLNGEGTGGGRAGAAKVGIQDITLVTGINIHVLPSVGTTNYWRG